MVERKKIPHKPEIKMAGMRQDAGAETVWKNRSHTHRVLVRFFQTFAPNKLMQTGHFNFGFRD
jgi:hypothetical protein